ncbi:curlin [Rhizobium sp. RU20A]|uniref:curlin n=1 Tax=Rhizobium sp. RU20A TaxID=1907412 RepID=UPI00122C2447|nr:curlin [Rhizobium sp. RU20A]
MTRTTLKILTITLLAGGLGPLALAGPAQAGGSISFNIGPRNAEEANLWSTGVQAYSLYRGIKNGDIRQLGRSNAAGLTQKGRGNLGIIRQRGDGHSATLQQNGDGNAYGIFQYGRNTDANVIQNGNGGSGATFTYGW